MRPLSLAPGPSLTLSRTSRQTDPCSAFSSIHIDAHLSGIRFFYKLLRNTEGWQAE